MTYLLCFLTQCLTSRLARAYYSIFYLSLEPRVGVVIHCPLGLFGPVVIGGGAVSTMYSSIVAFIVVLDFVYQVTFTADPDAELSSLRNRLAWQATAWQHIVHISFLS